MKLNPNALGLASGILGGAFWLVVMAISLLTGFGGQTLTTWGSWHLFFSYSWVGMVIMVIQHFIGCYIAGWLFAKVYNKFIKQSVV